MLLDCLSALDCNILSHLLYQIEMDHLKQLFERYMEKTLAFKKIHCKELVSITELNGVASLCRLYDSLATPENGVRTLFTTHIMFIKKKRLSQITHCLCILS